MYISGVSTRKVADITKELCGINVTSTQVSRCTTELDTELEKFRNRPLGVYPYVFLDARYKKVRHGGQVIDAALLVATGINPQGVREVLGHSVSLSEAEVHWKELLQGLTARGLHGVELIIRVMTMQDLELPERLCLAVYLATLSVSLCTECSVVCSSQEHAKGDRIGCQGYLLKG